MRVKIIVLTEGLEYRPAVLLSYGGTHRLFKFKEKFITRKNAREQAFDLLGAIDTKMAQYLEMVGFENA